MGQIRHLQSINKQWSDYKLHSGDSIRANLLSKTITFLKFPLAVLVVFLHCDISTKHFEKIGVSLEEISDPVYIVVSRLLSWIIGSAAVPSFFIISGFLLFYNIEALNTKIYISKLKKRCKSLLIPYVSWCLIYIFLYWVIGQKNIILSDVPNLFDGTLSPLNFIVTVFIIPLDGSLWFIRNLFLMVILSPIFYWIIRKTKYLLPFALFVFSLFIYNPIIWSFLWFSFGVSFAVLKFDFLYFCHRNLWLSLPIVVLTVILDFILYPRLDVHINYYFLIFMIMAIMGIGYQCVKRYPNIANNEKINNSSFTIYAYHSLPVLVFIPLIWNLSGKIGGGSTLTYLLTIVLIVFLGIVLSIFINKSKLLRCVLSGR